MMDPSEATCDKTGLMVCMGAWCGTCLGVLKCLLGCVTSVFSSHHFAHCCEAHQSG